MSDACPGCGRTVVPGGKFCRGCGRPLVQDAVQAPQTASARPVCGYCATPLVQDAHFCHQCGTTTAGKAPAKEPQADAKEDRTVVLGPLPGPEPQGRDEAITTALPRTSTAAPAVSPRESLRTDQVVTIVSHDSDDRSPRAGRPACGSCGAPASGAGRFCRACGAPLVGPQASRPSGLDTSSCPGCGHEVEAWAGFCRHCGHTLGAKAGERQPRVGPGAGRACEICGAPNAGAGGTCSYCARATAR